MKVFQHHVSHWMQICFGLAIAKDIRERNWRFLEEALELVQANKVTKEQAHELVEYTFNRPIGKISQEVGGVMVTLAALCNVLNIDIESEANKELDRIFITKNIEKIRNKQANKPKNIANSPLPN